jgi:hypothetical protein
MRPIVTVLLTFTLLLQPGLAPLPPAVLTTQASNPVFRRPTARRT